MAQGILESMPPGLRGMLAAEQMAQQRSSNQINQLGGILSLQNAMRQQQMDEEKMRRSGELQALLIGPGGGGQGADPLERIRAISAIDPARGRALLEVWKMQNPELNFSGGLPRDPRTGIPRAGIPAIPQTNQQGFSTTPEIDPATGRVRIGVTPGSAEAFGTQQRIGEESKASMDLVQVPMPGGVQTMTRANAARLLSQQPPPQAQPGIAPDLQGRSPAELAAIQQVMQASQRGQPASVAVPARSTAQPGMGAIPTASVVLGSTPPIGFRPEGISKEADEAYGKTLATKSVERDMSQHDAAQAAIDNIQKIDMVINHLKTSDAITGLGAEVLKDIDRARLFFTNEKKAGRRVSDTELLDTFLGSEVFPMIKALGIGARGLDTPAEREFLRRVMTGTVTMNKDTLIRMSEIRRDIAARAAEKWNKRVESGELDRYFEFARMPKQTIEIPERGALNPTSAPTDREPVPQGVTVKRVR